MRFHSLSPWRTIIIRIVYNSSLVFQLCIVG